MLRRERDKWFLVLRGRRAVEIAQACADRAHKERRPDIAAYWERRVARCRADPEWVLKIPLPQEYVDKRINQPTRFDGPPWWEGL